MGKGKPITYAQLKKLFALAKESGLDDELLHAHVATVTGKDSIKALTAGEAARLIDSLAGRPAGSRGADKASGRQMDYIYGLMKKMGWSIQAGAPDTARLDGFLQNRFRVGSHRWLDKGTASKLIEAFKEMSERPAGERPEEVEEAKKEVTA